MSVTAAFFRFEGTLSAKPSWAAAAWLAANAQGFSERMARISNVALAAPFVFAGPLKDPTRSVQLTWMGLRGMSDDRLHVLGAEYADRILIPNLRSAAVRLLEEADAAGRTPVLISDSLDVIIKPVAEHLGIKHFVSNRMEFRERKATGKLLDPVMNGHVATTWVKAFAREHSIDLEQSSAYGAASDDRMLLSAAGNPCVICPDRLLRSLARDLQWPVVDP